MLTRKTFNAEHVRRELARLLALGQSSGAVSIDAVETAIRNLARLHHMDTQQFFGQLLIERNQIIAARARRAQ